MSGEVFILFPSFIKLFPDLSGLGPSLREISAHHCRVCKPSLIEKACAPPTSPASSFLPPPLPVTLRQFMVKLSEPLLFYFPPLSFSKKQTLMQSSTLRNIMQRGFGSGFLRKKLAGDHVQIHCRAEEHYGDADILRIWWLPQYLTALTWVKT